MTKAVLIELLRGYLSGESATQDILHKIDPRRLNYYIGRAFNTLMYDIFRKEKNSLSLYCKTYTARVIAQDSITRVYSTTLPATIIQLPDAASGVRRVSFDNGTGLAFVPISAEQAQSFQGLDSANATINPTVGYYLRHNNKIEFFNMPSTMESETGTADVGGSGTALIRKTGTAFESSNISEGDIIHNTTDESWAEVVTITDDTNIVTTALAGGTADTWAEDDAYLCPSLRVDLVLPFEEYSSDENIYIPTGKDMELLHILIELLTQRKPVDLVNDNLETEAK